MQGAKDQCVAGKVVDGHSGATESGEYRGRRFADLDAQIKAEKAAQQPRTGVVGKAQHRRPGRPRLPVAVRKEIARFAQQLKRSPWPPRFKHFQTRHSGFGSNSTPLKA